MGTYIYSKKVRDKAIKLREKGLTLKEITEKLKQPDLHYRTVHMWMQKAGVVQGERKKKKIKHVNNFTFEEIKLHLFKWANIISRTGNGKYDFWELVSAVWLKDKVQHVSRIEFVSYRAKQDMIDYIRTQEGRVKVSVKSTGIKIIVCPSCAKEFTSEEAADLKNKCFWCNTLLEKKGKESFKHKHQRTKRSLNEHVKIKRHEENIEFGDGIADKHDYIGEYEIRDLWNFIFSNGFFSAREKEIMRLYYIDGLTMRETGEQINICESRISQVLSLITPRLKSILVRKGGYQCSTVS